MQDERPQDDPFLSETLARLRALRAVEEPEDAFAREVAAELLADERTAGLLSPEALEDLRDDLHDLLTLRPDALALMNAARPRTAPQASGAVASDERAAHEHRGLAKKAQR